MPSTALPPTSNARARQAFVVAVIVTLALFVIPFGDLIGYPLVLLSTYAHELGHGLAALAVGAKFHQLEIYASAGGVATHSGAGSNIARALISAGGLVGPALLAFALFLSAPRPRLAKAMLVAFGIGCLAVDVIFVRNLFGAVFVGLLGVAALGIAFRTQAETARTVVVFLAIQLSLSVFSRGDYLFMKQADVGGGRVMPSDVQHISEALGAPYFVWGALIGLFSVVVLAVGAFVFFRATRESD